MKKAMKYGAILALAATAPAMVNVDKAEAASAYELHQIVYKLSSGYIYFPSADLLDLIASSVPNATNITYLVTGNGNYYNMADYTDYYVTNSSSKEEDIFKSLETLAQNLTKPQIASLAVTPGQIKNGQMQGNGTVITPEEEEFKVISIE